MNPNDEIRAQLLQWFYDRNASATSQYGKKGSSVKISDVKAGLKQSFGLSQQQVMANLTYLIDKGWINKTEIEKTVNVRGGSVPSTVTWYEISSAGIDKIEGESEFQQNQKYSGIKISAMGTNVITLGDGNVVNAEFADLRKELDTLKALVIAAQIEESAKLEIAADLESIKDQLAKTKPNTSVIKQLWNQVEKVATVGGAADLVQKIGSIIASIT
jgi:hypothetical protein